MNDSMKGRGLFLGDRALFWLLFPFCYSKLGLL